MDMIYLVTRLGDGKSEPIGLCRPEDFYDFCRQDASEHYTPGYILVSEDSIEIWQLRIERNKVIGKHSFHDTEDYGHYRYTFKSMPIYHVKYAEEE